MGILGNRVIGLQNSIGANIIRGLVRRGFSETTITRHLNQRGIFPSLNNLRGYVESITTSRDAAARFERTRPNTILSANRFARSKSPERLRNNFVATFRLERVNMETGEVFDSFTSIGFDEPMTKSQLLQKVDDRMRDIESDSPNLIVNLKGAELLLKR